MDAIDPVAQFEAWLAEAEASEPNDPTAVCLATSTPDGRPSARMVLLKGVDRRPAPGGGRLEPYAQTAFDNVSTGE